MAQTVRASCRCAEAPEEALVHDALSEQAVGAAVGKRQDRLGAVRRADLPEARGDLAQSLVPRHALEAALALGSDAPHRMQQAIRAADASAVVRGPSRR